MIQGLKTKIAAGIPKIPKRLRVGSHEVEEETLISEGGYGYIWRVRDVRSGEIFALKKMICQNTERLQTAKNEIAILRAIPTHPNIMKLIDSDIVSQNGNSVVLMLLELCEGGSLFDLMTKYENQRLNESQVIGILKQICEGIKVLHSMQPPVAHRDLKIENVLLHQKRFKLCDFGSSTRTHLDMKRIPKDRYADLEEEFEKNTTLMYRPPEMCNLYEGHTINEKVDIWMLGCILFVVCFYKHPFAEASKLSIVNASFQIPERSNYTDKMHDLIRLMLTPDPAHRPDIFQVINILERYDQLQNIELNRHAQELKLQQQKASKTIEAKFKSFQGEIPADELAKLQQRIAAGDKKGSFTVSNTKNFAVNNAPVQQQPQRSQPAPRQEVRTSNTNGFTDFGFGVPSNGNSNAFSNNSANNWGSFNWDQPAPAAVQKPAAQKNAFDDLWNAPPQSQPKVQVPTPAPAPAPVPAQVPADLFWAWGAPAQSNPSPPPPAQQARPVQITDSLIELDTDKSKDQIMNKLSDIKF
eukprot:TRINITY_DN870_c0_g1_i27.p1 TRINITY_DN870_c0_g1~~TRINITY_DN870_c0_g1_i27.p1  ORF type:complete len:526 (-),score=124.53 TRINITY_DN870_c0_g1_i27:62-1639(-)